MHKKLATLCAPAQTAHLNLKWKKCYMVSIVMYALYGKYSHVHVIEYILCIQGVQIATCGRFENTVT